ncbi:hypothetical protein B7463_g4608, partial [Scytalidium lignicola]
MDSEPSFQRLYTLSGFTRDTETHVEPNPESFEAVDQTQIEVFFPGHNYLGSTDEPSNQTSPYLPSGLNHYYPVNKSRTLHKRDSDLYTKIFPVESNQHTTYQPDQHLIQSPPLGLLQQRPSLAGHYNDQNSTAAPISEFSTPFSQLQYYPYHHHQQQHRHQQQTALHGAQQIGLQAIHLQPIQQPTISNSLENIGSAEANGSGLGHSRNDTGKHCGCCYLSRSHGVSPTYQDLTAMGGTHLEFEAQIGLRPTTNIFETHCNDYRSVTDNYSGLSLAPAVSVWNIDNIPSSQFEPPTIMNLHDSDPSSHYSTNNLDQARRTHAILESIQNMVICNQNDVDCGTYIFESGNQRGNLSTAALPNVTTTNGKGLAVSPSAEHSKTKIKKRNYQQKKRGSLTEDKKVVVNGMRKRGSCWSCHINKKACDFNTPCRNCKNNTKAKIFNQPCCRLNIMDVIPYRRGNSRMGKTESKLPELNWSDKNVELKTIQLVYPFKIDDGCLRPVLEVKCREFNPDPDEVLNEEYQVDGRLIKLPLPPYACFDLYDHHMKDKMSNFMDKCKECMENTMRDAITDELCKLTIAEATCYSKGPNGKYVDKALKIRAGAFLIASSFSMQGKENLGVQKCHTKTPSYFKDPLPTVLEYQMDTLSIDVMKGHLTPILKHLKYLIFKEKTPKEVCMLVGTKTQPSTPQ